MYDYMCCVPPPLLPLMSIQLYSKMYGGMGEAVIITATLHYTLKRTRAHTHTMYAIFALKRETNKRLTGARPGYETRNLPAATHSHTGQ